MSFGLRQWRKEVDDFLCGIEAPLAARAITLLAMLEERGNQMNPKHSKALGDGLFELRVDSRGRALRFFYVFSKPQLIVVLGCLDKKTQKTPDSVLDQMRDRQRRLSTEGGSLERPNKLN